MFGEFLNIIVRSLKLDKTLSSFGGVTRGLCTVNDEKLNTVIETADLEKTDYGVSSNRDIELDGSEPVSMNVWGFTPILFKYLNEKFVEFLSENGTEMKSEYLIPSVVNELIQSGQETVHVLRSGATWFGVTYKDDKPFVEGEIEKLVNKGEYPGKLF